MEIYKIENLNFAYTDQGENVLSDISFSVEEGQFLTICGLSGSGKSTLLRQLKTVLRPYGRSSGRILYKGKPLDETEELTQAFEIGFVMQSPDHQSVTDRVWHELAFGLENFGTPSQVIRRKTAEMAAFFGLTDILQKKISQLSGGQKQILNLASVMIQEPSVLILDEPISQLDPISADVFISLLKKIHDEFGTTVILCEHSLEQICMMSDEIIVLEDGKLAHKGTPKEIAMILATECHPMFESMPVSVRISALCEKSGGSIPMTAAEGKKWLKNYADGKELNKIEHKYNSHDEKEKPIVKLKNIFFRYDKKTSDVLKGISLNAWSGEVFALMGSNGTGKTTLLHTIAGILKPYSGSVSIGTKDSPARAGLLPQNPQSLFLMDTVEKDLYSVFSSDICTEDRHKMTENVIKLCGLEKLRTHHPYDLSGGEQQRAALAKVLLCSPDILLLDEPVKGMDVKSKAEMGEILRSLAQSGICVIIVSHDMDFCAEFSDRCALLSEGEIIDSTAPDKFFSENSFFTTPARCMSKGVIPDAVTVDDIRKALSITFRSNVNKPDNGSALFSEKTISPDTKLGKKKHSIFSMFFYGIIFAVFIISAAAVTGMFGLQNALDNTLIAAVVMVLSAGILIFHGIRSKQNKSILIRPVKQPAKFTITALVLIFAAIPATIFMGIYFFGDTKYLFISLLIMLECTVPFFLIFENRHVRARELVLIAVMCAMAVTSRAAFYMFPQFKPLTAVVIIASSALGAESGFLIGSLSMLVSNILFGQGPWTPWQMFSMGLIGFLSGLFFGRNLVPRNKFSFCIFGFFAALLIYGGIMDPAAMLMSHIEPTYENVVYFYMTGLPLDTVHAVSTAVFLFLAAEPIIHKLERVKLKYGLISIVHEKINI